MKCPKCGNVGEILVEIAVKIPSDKYMQITKKLISSKECKVMWAGWPKARFMCKSCGYVEKGL